MSDLVVEMKFGKHPYYYCCGVCGERAEQYVDADVEHNAALGSMPPHYGMPPIVCASEGETEEEQFHICKACLDSGRREERLEARIKKLSDSFAERVEAYAKGLREEIAKLESLRGNTSCMWM